MNVSVRWLLGLWLAISLTCVQGAEPAELEETDVFVSGQDGYHTYRIPSVIATKQGTLLAFCEGRKKDRSDAGDIDLVLRRSADQGKTWSPMQKVWSDKANTCGNPCPVVDQETGTIWLLLTWNDGGTRENAIQPGFGQDSRRVFVTYSDDDGETWAEPKEITRDVKREDWTWYATGPGAGIQLTRGKHKGRLVSPCDHKRHEGKRELGYSHVIYSDDHGKTWQLGGETPTDKCNECEVVELADGRLLLNMRSHDNKIKNRQVSYSDDGGATWSEPQSDAILIEPICQASIRRYRWPSDDKPGVILFSNPASTTKRERLTLRASLDEGKTWPHQRALYAGPSAYSCLCVLPSGRIGCLYEKDNYQRITFARIEDVGQGLP